MSIITLPYEKKILISICDTKHLQRKKKEKITYHNSPRDSQEDKIYIQSTFNYYLPSYSKLLYYE